MTSSVARRPKTNVRGVAILPLLAAVAAAAAGCARLAEWAAPRKRATTLAERRPSALKADALMWQTLHGGQYERIDDTLTALTAAYLENPRDAVTAGHLGFMHTWRLSERARLDAVPPTITDHAVLARRYFGESVQLDPGDARILGFYGSLLLAEGKIHQDETLTRRGYYTLRDAIDAWPEFNYFTAGYAMSQLPYDSRRYAEALDFQWRNLDVCAGRKIDRQHPSYGEFMVNETKQGPKRVCWNSWIAPHNFEGFFLNMGDMLVKAGQVETATRIYAMARLTRDYPAWKYRDVLEARVRDAQRNVVLFRATDLPGGQSQIMVQSRFACAGCHEE